MVSIIIPTVDRHRSLVKLVESIRSQNFNAAPVEILIVYNLSKKKRAPTFYIPYAAGIKVLQAPFAGVNHARNAGIIAARGDILLFVDDDCVMDDRLYLQKMWDRHREQPERLSLGGPYRLPRQASFWDQVYYTNMTLWLERQKTSARASRALLGGNASYKAAVFSDGRRFTPGIKYGGSETMFNEKLFEDHGPHGFYDDLALTHQSCITLKNFIYKAYMQGRGYAEQTKHTTADLQAPLDLSVVSSRRMRWALHFYSFVFMVGYRTSIYERRFWLKSLWEECWVYLKKPWQPVSRTLFYSWRVLKVGDDVH
jgi:glycosyltransferase involved in cell wall biosynthesis